MGAQAKIVDSVHIFIAIAAHKGLAAYALGSSVVDSQVIMKDVRAIPELLVGRSKHTVMHSRRCDNWSYLFRFAGKHAEVLDGDWLLCICHSCGDPPRSCAIQCLQ